MEFLRRIHGVTLCDKMRSYERCKALNVEPLSRLWQSRFGLATWP